MSFRGRVSRLLRTVRASGSTAVDIGDFTPADASGSYPASVVLWDDTGGDAGTSWFCALAMQDAGIGGHPVAYLGLGQRAVAWGPNLKLYNGGGVSVQGSGALGGTVLDFTDTDPGASQVNGYTRLLFNTLETTKVGPPAGQSLTIDGAGNPINITGGDVILGGQVLPRGLVASNINTSPSGGTTTAAATILQCLAVPFTAGRSYRLTFSANLQSTVAGDDIVGRVTVNGVTVQLGQMRVPKAGSGYMLEFTLLYQPTTSGTWTVNGDIYRSAGSGTVNAYGSTTEPFYLSIEDVGT